MNGKSIGTLLIVLGGVVAIGLAIVVSHSATPLLGAILVAQGIQMVSTESESQNGQPIFLGMIIGFSYLGIGIVSLYLQNPTILLGMLLANWVGASMVK